MDYKFLNKDIDDPRPISLDGPFDELSLLSCLSFALSIYRKEGHKKFKLELDLSDATPEALAGIAVHLEELELEPSGTNILKFPK